VENLASPTGGECYAPPHPAAISRDNASGTAGQTYGVAGPEVYTLRDLVRIVLRHIGKWRPLVPVPFAVAEVQARLFELLPGPPLTTSQVDLLKEDNVASGALPGFRELNIQPKTVEEDRTELHRPVARAGIGLIAIVSIRSVHRKRHLDWLRSPRDTSPVRPGQRAPGNGGCPRQVARSCSASSSRASNQPFSHAR